MANISCGIWHMQLQLFIIKVVVGYSIKVLFIKVTITNCRIRNCEGKTIGMMRTNKFLDEKKTWPTFVGSLGFLSNRLSFR